MRISGNAPSSVILSQTELFKKLEWLPESAKTKLKPKGIVQQTHKITISIILVLKIFMLLNAKNQPKLTVELGYMCPWGLTGPPAVVD